MQIKTLNKIIAVLFFIVWFLLGKIVIYVFLPSYLFWFLIVHWVRKKENTSALDIVDVIILVLPIVILSYSVTLFLKMLEN